jgi:hypothetical protein
VQEWQRDFATYVPGSPTYVSGSTLPTLTLLRIMHDHTGNFGGSDPAVAGLSTPELQQADNDYAVGQVMQTVAHSPFPLNYGRAAIAANQVALRRRANANKPPAPVNMNHAVAGSGTGVTATLSRYASTWVTLLPDASPL